MKKLQNSKTPNIQASSKFPPAPSQLRRSDYEGRGLQRADKIRNPKQIGTEERLDRCREVLKNEGVDYLFVWNEFNRKWFADVREWGFGCVLVMKEKAWIIGPPGFLQEMREKFEQVESVEVVGYGEKGLIDKVREILTDGSRSKQMAKVGFEKDLPYGAYVRLRNKLKGFSLKGVRNLAGKLRAVKFEDEVKRVNKAIKATEKAFEYIQRNVKVGMTEAKIAWEMEKYARENFGAKLFFDPIVAIDENSAVPHHETSEEKRLEEGSVILVDFGVKVGGYGADMTRTWKLGEKVSSFRWGSGKVELRQLKVKSKSPSARLRINEKGEEFRRVSRVVEKALGLAKSLGKPGAKCAEVDKKLRKFIKSKGYQDLPHALGHGVGLEGHEPPHVSKYNKYDEVFEKGMCVALEPAVYLEGKFGVRLEETVVVD